MADWLETELTSLGVAVTKVDLGKHTLDGEELQLPPALLGKIGEDKSKKTVLLYAHYDVQPVSRRASGHVRPSAKLYFPPYRSGSPIGRYISPFHPPLHSTLTPRHA